jgi:hypothetical protein
MAVDLLLVSLGSTAGWRAADEELVGALERAGAQVAIARAEPPGEVRTFMLTDWRWARAARRAAIVGIAEHRPGAVLYSTVTAALMWPTPGAIRLDATAAVNRPGRHGMWQRPVERRRLAAAPLLVPTANGVVGEISAHADRSIVVPIPVEPSAGPWVERDIAALAYAANPAKKGFDRVVAAWRAARRPEEELVVAGSDEIESEPGVRSVGRLAPDQYRALLRRSRVFVTAPRREDYGIAQLEALADGCVLVTTAAPGAYPALGIARALDARLVGDDVASALRAALDDPPADYAERAAEMLAPFRRAAADTTVADELLPRLLGDL